MEEIWKKTCMGLGVGNSHFEKWKTKQENDQIYDQMIKYIYVDMKKAKLIYIFR